ncbi:hypothetical protein GHK86_07210 [Acidimicrobiaceae bacterium USS-CC1]|uniref:Uncharacterized protein n=1 Tax=Acidiferrimicrobium australe TaxID=2664430 RepID=A0ABW9QS03_9ACTN|nr:hypothetical protein [Acidiferrimicrobium australe]
MGDELEKLIDGVGVGDGFRVSEDVFAAKRDRVGLVGSEVDGPAAAAGGEEDVIVSDVADGLMVTAAGASAGDRDEHERDPRGVGSGRPSSPRTGSLTRRISRARRRRPAGVGVVIVFMA